MAKAVLFDLDGTLIDSAYDIGAVCNLVAKQYGYAPMAMTDIRPFVGQGSWGVLAAITGLDSTNQHLAQMREEVLKLYAQSQYTHTALFPELRPMLQQLNNAGIVWGIVTSKPRIPSMAIIERDLDMAFCHTLVSRDDVVAIKPEPEGLLLAIHQLQLERRDTLYVGDNFVDVLAARSAGMPCVAVGYGYCLVAESPIQYDPDYYAHTPQDLAYILPALLQSRLSLG